MDTGERKSKSTDKEKYFLCVWWGGNEILGVIYQIKKHSSSH